MHVCSNITTLPLYIQVHSDSGEPFYMNKPIDVIRRCFGHPDISNVLQRIPVSHSDTVT